MENHLYGLEIALAIMFFAAVLAAVFSWLGLLLVRRTPSLQKIDKVLSDPILVFSRYREKTGIRASGQSEDLIRNAHRYLRTNSQLEDTAVSPTSWNRPKKMKPRTNIYERVVNLDNQSAEDWYENINQIVLDDEEYENMVAVLGPYLDTSLDFCDSEFRYMLIATVDQRNGAIIDHIMLVDIDWSVLRGKFKRAPFYETAVLAGSELNVIVLESSIDDQRLNTIAGRQTIGFMLPTELLVSHSEEIEVLLSEAGQQLESNVMLRVPVLYLVAMNQYISEKF